MERNSEEKERKPDTKFAACVLNLIYALYSNTSAKWMAQTALSHVFKLQCRLLLVTVMVVMLVVLEREKKAVAILLPMLDNKSHRSNNKKQTTCLHPLQSQALVSRRLYKRSSILKRLGCVFHLNSEPLLAFLLLTIFTCRFSFLSLVS